MKEESRKLFDKLNIEKDKKIMELQGAYPVIFITLKELKSDSFEGFLNKLRLVIPKDVSKFGIIIEFKKIDELSKESVEEAAKNALKQIKEKKYESELLEREINNIIKLAIVFKNKDIEIIRG